MSELLMGLSLPWQLALCYGAAHVGILVHYLKKAARAETQSTFVQFFFLNNFAASLLSYLGCMGTVTALLLQSTTAVQLIVPAFTAGIAFNSILNKETP